MRCKRIIGTYCWVSPGNTIFLNKKISQKGTLLWPDPDPQPYWVDTESRVKWFWKNATLFWANSKIACPNVAFSLTQYIRKILTVTLKWAMFLYLHFKRSHLKQNLFFSLFKSNNWRETTKIYFSSFVQKNNLFVHFWKK